MGTLWRAVGNSGLMLASQLATWTTTLILTSALASRLGDAGFGSLYLAMSFVAICSVVIGFGLNEQLVRAVARDRHLAGSYLANSMVIRLVLVVIAYALILMATFLLGYAPQLRRLIAVYCAILLFNGVSSLLAALFGAFENTFPMATGVVLEKVFNMVMAVVLLWQGLGVTTLAAVFVTGAALNMFWQVFQLRKMGPLAATIDLSVMVSLLRGALPFFFYWVFSAIYGRIDIILLSKLTTPAVVGWYGAAYRLSETLFFVPSIVSSVILLPILSRLAMTSRDQLRLALGKGLDLLVVLGVPICTGLFVLAEPIIRFIYQAPEFINAVPALRWLAIALAFSYVNSALSVMVVSLNMERKMTTAAGFAMLLNLSFNWILIPRFQHLAAAAVTTGTEVFLLGFLLVCTPKDLISRSSGVVLLKACAAGGIMVGVLRVAGDHSLPVLVLTGGITYCLSALALCLVPSSDLRALGAALASRHK